MARVRLKKRILRSRQGALITKPIPKEPERQYSTAASRIIKHPEFSRVVEMLKKGVSVPTIVNWFEREAWLGTMSPSTFTQYLYKFKTECADIIKGSVQPNESYDHYVGTNIPSVNAETELDKLIMIQKRRLSVDIATEIGIGKLLDNTHKEIVALGELLKLKGLKTADADTATDSMALRTMRVNEGEQDRMQELTTDLFKAIKDASKTGNSSKSKQKQRA